MKMDRGKNTLKVSQLLSAAMQDALVLALQYVLLVTYSLLPSVSRKIFAARQCESFVYDSRNIEPLSYKAYLLADPDILCSTREDESYKSLQVGRLHSKLIWNDVARYSSGQRAATRCCFHPTT